MKILKEINSFFKDTTYSIEIKNNHIYFKTYDGYPFLDTKIKYDIKEYIKTNELNISLENNVLLYNAINKPMNVIKSLKYTNNKLIMVVDEKISGVIEYILDKTSEGPFADKIILDKEYRKIFNGKWVDNKDKANTFIIKNNKLTFYLDNKKREEVKIHIMKYKTSDTIYITNYMLHIDGVGMYTPMTYINNMLTCYMMVLDENVPQTQFVREKSLDK